MLVIIKFSGKKICKRNWCEEVGNFLHSKELAIGFANAQDINQEAMTAERELLIKLREM